MGAAVLGLIAGLMIVVPAVLWLSGFFSPQNRGRPRRAGPPAPSSAWSMPRPADVTTVRVQVRPMDQVRPVGEAARDRRAVRDRKLEPRGAAIEAQAQPPPASPSSAAAQLADPNKARIDACSPRPPGASTAAT